MYTTNYSTTITLRANSSFPLPYAPFPAVDLAVRRNFLLASHFIRQSSLLYWSPSRRLAAARYHLLTSNDRDFEQKKEASNRLCCHCRRSGEIGPTDELRGRFRGERRDLDGFWKRSRSLIRSSESEEDGGFFRCEIRKFSRNRGRRNGYGGGWRVNYGIGEFSESGNGGCRCGETRSRRVYGTCGGDCDCRGNYDDYSEEEEEERRRECFGNVDRRSLRLRDSVGSRRRKELGSSSYGKKYGGEEKRVEDDDYSSEEEFRRRESYGDSRRRNSVGSRKTKRELGSSSYMNKYGGVDKRVKKDDYSSDEEDRRRESYGNLKRRDSVGSRKTQRELGSSSYVRKYGEVEKRVGGRGEWEGDQRAERGSSYRHEAREEFRRGQGSTFAGKDSKEDRWKFASVSDIYEEDDIRKVSGSKKCTDEARMQREKGASNVHYLDKVGKKFTGQADFKMKGRQQYFHEDEEDSRLWDSREGTRKFVEISEVNNDDTVMISNIKNVVDKRKVNMQDSYSSSSSKKHSEVDERIGLSKTRNSVETLKEISEIHDSNTEEVWHGSKDYSAVNLNDRHDSLTSVQKIRDAKSQYETMMETKETSSNAMQYNQGGSKLVGQDEHRFEGRQQYMHGVGLNLREMILREGHQKFVDISEANADESMHISNLKSNVDSRKSKIDETSSSAFKQYTEVDVRTSSISNSKTVKTPKETSKVYDSNTDVAWNRSKQHNEVTLKVINDQSDSVQIERHKREKDYENLISSARLNTELIDPNETCRNNTNVSVANVSGIKVGSSSERYNGTRVNAQENYSTSSTNLVYEGEEHQREGDKWCTQLTGPTKESGKYLQSELSRKDATTVSSTEASSQVDDCQHGSMEKLRTDILTSGLPRRDSQMLSSSQVISNTQINIVLNDQHRSQSETVIYKKDSGTSRRDSDIVSSAETASSVRMNDKFDDIEHSRRKEYEQHLQVSKLTGRVADRVPGTQGMSSVHLNDELDDQPYSSIRESEKYLQASELSRRNVTRADMTQTTPSLLLDTKLHDHGLERHENDQSVSSFSREDEKIDSNIQVVSSMRPKNCTASSSSMSRQDTKEKENTLVESSQLAETTDIASTTTYEIGSGSSNAHNQAENAQSSFDAMVGVEVDILGSASRLDKSSALFVGEFAMQLQQEASASQRYSEIQAEAAAKESIHTQGYSGPQVDETQNDIIQTTTVNMSQPDATIKHESGYSIRERKWRSSSLPAIKGPSDKMWETGSLISEEELHKEAWKIHSAAQVVETATPTSATSSAVTRRSPRSLWAFIADIARLRWTSHARSGALDQHEGLKTSPHHSTGSEAWFSGQEVDDSDEETDKKGQIGTTKGSLILTQSTDQTQESRYSGLEQRVSEAPKLVEGVVPSEISSSTLITGGSISADAPVSILEGSVDTGAVAGATMVPPILISVDKPSITSVTASHKVGTSKSDMKIPPIPLGGFTRLEAESSGDPTNIQESAEKDGQLKRRKFQRNNQVFKESFEDWEEAYRLESEQRKIDELFMREALAEAQKAGDMWEVPVGAVLVQNGKIIARACNLVEDMRDSTAHAEMICIREASNLLRTWRLAGTTLYVTLEPCPMCAGAILQARIDVVVWGAPNKLLGADGSWVRLFPTGDGSSSSLDTSSQLAGPIHPFHPKIIIRRGVLATECSDVMQQFFRIRRKKEKKPESSSKESSSKESSSKHSRLHLSRHPAKLFTKMQNIFTIMFCL